MVEGNASMYLGSPRMVEVVVGEKVDLEGWVAHACTAPYPAAGISWLRDDGAAIALGRRYLSYFPQRHDEAPPAAAPGPARPGRSIGEIIPQEPGRVYDMHRVIDRIVDEGSWLEVKELFAPEILCGLARLDGEVVGVVANQPQHRGGVLFIDTPGQGGAFHLAVRRLLDPASFLADVPAS